MPISEKKEITEYLSSYPIKQQQIKLLQYELEHPTYESVREIATPNRTQTVALLNRLKAETSKLEYYVGLLEEKQALVIEKRYFKQKTLGGDCA